MKNSPNPDPGCASDTIHHKGIIKKEDNKFYYVSIIAQSACNACHAKGVCNVSDLNEEIIEITKTESDSYKIGDEVEVAMEKSLGTVAVMLGYIIPFLLVLITLIGMLALSVDQGVAGLISLGILIPYYLILYMNRNHLKKTFVFKIR